MLGFGILVLGFLASEVVGGVPRVLCAQYSALSTQRSVLIQNYLGGVLTGCRWWINWSRFWITKIT